MRMSPAIILAVSAGLASAQTTSAREVQIRSVDFDTGVIELFNFAATDIDLSGWRFCTHDFDDVRRYTAPSGFNGVTIEAGTSVFVHFNNDAPAGDADRIDRSDLGSFAAPLDQDAYALQLFFPASNGSVSFGNSSLIADHLQWNVDAGAVGSTEFRTAQAVGETLWSANGDFIATEAGSGRIDLIDNSGDIAGSPSEYAVSFPNSVYNEAIDGDLSDDANAPTGIAIVPGSNGVEGQVNLSNDTTNGDRDFVTVTVPNGQTLTGLTLVQWDPNNIGFIAVNDGSTGFVPSGATDASFLSGILVDTSNEGDDLLDAFRDQSVTQNSLAEDRLPAGDYTFVVQQTSNLTQDYALDFILTETSRQVQVTSIDFDTGVVEVTNLGGFDEDLSGWRFCSHDFNQARVYTAPGALNGVTLAAGESIFVHFNDDAPLGDADRFNRSDLGNFALPLDQDAYALQLFFPGSNGSVSFGNSSLIADHLQWNIDGQGAGSAETRTGQAVSESLWSDTGDFIATEADSASIELVDLSGDKFGNPDEYQVNAGVPGCNSADLVAPFGALDLSDVQTFLIAFGSQDPVADLFPVGAPDGVFDLGDVQTFLIDFGAGCP